MSYQNYLYDNIKELDLSINLKQDVLTKKFLENFKLLGSKILHMTPTDFDIEKNQRYLIIEDENFNQVKMTPDMLKKILTPEEESKSNLNIDLVILDIPNCDDFINVFIELGVKHIISFEAMDHFILSEDQSHQTYTHHLN